MTVMNSSLLELMLEFKNNVCNEDQVDYQSLDYFLEMQKLLQTNTTQNKLSTDEQQKYDNICNDLSLKFIDIVKKKMADGSIKPIEDQTYAREMITRLKEIGVEEILKIYADSDTIKNAKHLFNLSSNSLLVSSSSSIHDPVMPVTINPQEDIYSSSITFNLSPNEILEEIEKLLLGQETGVSPEIQSINKLKELKKQYPDKFKLVIELKSTTNDEENTLLLTALSSEKLKLAKYLLEEKASIKGRNKYGIDSINMIAMIHPDLDNRQHLNISDIENRIKLIKELLEFMKSQDEKYFQDNINKPRIYVQNGTQKLGSSIPLTKVIGYCYNPDALEPIVKVWRDLGADTRSIDAVDSNFSPVCNYALGKGQAFIKAVARIFPTAFSEANLIRKNKNGETVIDKIFSSIEQSYEEIEAIVDLDENLKNKQDITKQIQHACKGKTVILLRDLLLTELCESKLDNTCRDPEIFLKKLDELNSNKNLWQFLEKYDGDHDKAKKVINEKITSLTTLKQNNLQSNNIDAIIDKLKGVLQTLDQSNNISRHNTYRRR